MNIKNKNNKNRMNKKTLLVGILFGLMIFLSGFAIGQVNQDREVRVNPDALQKLIDARINVNAIVVGNTTCDSQLCESSVIINSDEFKILFLKGSDSEETRNNRDFSISQLIETYAYQRLTSPERTNELDQEQVRLRSR